MAHPVVQHVTQAIEARSEKSRSRYLAMLADSRRQRPSRGTMGCANLAHATAALETREKITIQAPRAPNLGIVTAYNDMLSAHKPYEHYPARIREEALRLGATAQVAGGVPAMCDGITQGYEGMELSLFSRDVIALSTAVALSHNVFDAAVHLGICDKIVPGLLIGALQFGHLPQVFIPSGPMPTGISNGNKAKVRQQFALGEVGREALLASEQAAYHGQGTCTFYGTANSNQLMLEFMGLQLPGSSFVPPNTPLRDALTRASVQTVLGLVQQGPCLGELVTAKTLVNGAIGLLASGGSTNHAIHLMAIAKAAGIQMNWDDLSALSAVIPLVAKVYPNGKADVNHFHAAGGVPFMIQSLLHADLLHADVQTILGVGLSAFGTEPSLQSDAVRFQPAPLQSLDEAVLRSAAEPFSVNGGLVLLQGNLGRAVAKISAVAPEHQRVTAPAVVVESQQALQDLFKAGALERDFVAVVLYQGPKANGMPELHKLTPLLGALQDKGFQVALVTDGRMSGASGKVPAAIHLSPECLLGGAIGKIRDGDLIRLDCQAGVLEALVEQAEWNARPQSTRVDSEADQIAMSTFGRGLFACFRNQISTAEEGASPLGFFSDQ
jgi:phosphogluconate dehydratase